MREIKFRVWDENAREMWYFDLNNSCNFTPDDLKKSQQYTGLKDKQSKEIYEGDMLRLPKAMGYSPEDEFITHDILTVYYEEAQFMVRFDDGEEMFLSDCWDKDNNELEIIGNIYQNPELLTKDKENESRI